MSFTRVLSVLTAGLLSSALHAQTGAPPELARWQNWVQAAKPERACPIAATDDSQHICHFPAELAIDITEYGASFRQTGERYSAGLVELVGSSDNWPQAVTVNGETAVVTPRDGKPVISLPVGHYQIAGRLQWQKLPSQLPLPPETGLVQLTKAGEAIAPRIESEQLLLASEPVAANDVDQVNFRIFRLLEDAVPQRLTTLLDVDVSGADRQLTTGQLLLSGFAPIALESELPAKLNDDGSLSLQLRPGRFQVKLIARAINDTTSLAPAKAAENWPAEELWSVAEDLSLRQLQFAGATQVDPKQTELPPQWHHLPAFIVSAEQGLNLQVLQQGRDQQAANLNLTLERTLWLDFDGKGFTSRERINGEFAEPARLLAQASYQLGSASVNSQPQVITHLPDQEDKLGIALPAGSQFIETSGRADNWRQFSASGWQHGFAQARTELKLPPGWQLLHAQGADRVRNSWLTEWDLWAIFLVVIVTAASWQLFGVGGGLLAALAFVLSFHSQPLLAYWALLSLLLLAITRALPANRFRHWCGVGSALACLVFTLICLPFFVQELRAAFYPQLAQRDDYFQVSAYDDAAAPAPAVMQAEIAASAEEPAVMMAAPEPHQKRLSSKSRPSKAAGKPHPALDSSMSRLGNAQTGPALPSWQWSRAELSWSGPIAAEQQVTLWALPPIATMFWRIASVLLVGCFLAVTLLQLAKLWRSGAVSKSTAARASAPAALAPFALALLLLSAAPINDVAAESFPSEALLQELSERLDTQATQACPAGQCGSIERVGVQLQRGQLTLQLRAHAARPLALPLPAKAGHWLPQTIRVNGEQSLAFKQDDSGLLWLALPAGVANIELQGRVSANSVALPFALGAPNLSLALDDTWQAQGLRDGKLTGAELLLSRSDPDGTGAQQLSGENKHVFPSFAQVERRLEFKTEWLVTTTVRRIAPEVGALRLSLPLLAGESVLSAEVEVKNQRAQVALAADQASLSWQSRLAPQAELKLTAAENAPYAERWIVASEPIWQVDYQGINPLNQPGDALTWQPRAGESVTLHITSPIASKGATYTIERANLSLRPGARAADSELNLQVRASAGGLLPLSLPADSELLKLYIDGREQQLSARDGKLNLPLSPGNRNYQLSLRHNQPQNIITRTPVFATEAALNNIELSIEPPANRWILAVSGPLLGPAITYWGVLLVIVAAAILLGRWAWLPFGAATWLVLGIGMSTVNAVGSLWVVAWFIALRWRADLNTQTYSAAKLQWLQIGLALLTAIAGWQLLSTIPISLLSQPEMMIGGYNSSSHSLNWYQDHAASMPVAQVVSLPLWVYRALMLAWSLWLALSLLKFARFGWQAFSARELWRTKPPAPAKAQAKPAAKTAAPSAPAPESDA